ncbi:hypothetical protein [Arsenicicoccus sp. oral taxon 190]|uniref:hypothetical protein n=1 Tax=Arsenicicoccus sp. oral taxon 190 TaxID=1658671 RepID=UPI00067A1E7D|nr:hypothetical protein [Arsenicicoccus sp. oral taxon 190]AKT50770.1 hypothetical protein ADJ73_04635 [Arsenicicoccus sp. oral taxon 190]
MGELVCRVAAVPLADGVAAELGIAGVTEGAAVPVDGAPGAPVLAPVAVSVADGDALAAPVVSAGPLHAVITGITVTTRAAAAAAVVHPGYLMRPPRHGA